MKNNINYSTDERFKKTAEQEIGLQDMILSLWNGKVILVIAVLIFSSVSFFRAYNKPTVYVSSSEIEVVNDPYSLQELNTPVYLDSIFNYLNSAHYLSKLTSENSKVSLSGLTVTKKENGIFSVSMSSLERDIPYIGVKQFVDNANAGIKERELKKAVLSLSGLEEINITEREVDMIKSDISDIKARLLLKESLLNNNSFEILSVLTPPTNPSVEIKPNVLLSTITGGVLGFVFGSLIILGRMLVFPKQRK